MQLPAITAQLLAASSRLDSDPDAFTFEEVRALRAACWMFERSAKTAHPKRKASKS